MLLPLLFASRLKEHQLPERNVLIAEQRSGTEVLVRKPATLEATGGAARWNSRLAPPQSPSGH